MLALLLLAAVPGADLLEGCKRSPSPGGVQYACDGMIASVAEVKGLAVKDALATQVEGIRASVQGEVTTREAPFTSDGKTWSGLALSVKKPGDPAPYFDARLLAFESKPGTVRMAMCGTPSSGGPSPKCDKLLAVFAREGPAPYAGPPVEPKFLGKKLELEKDCQTLDASEKGFSVACGNTLLSVMTLESAAEMQKVLEMLGNELVQRTPGAKEGERRACKIGGVATKCRTIEAKDASSELTLILGAAQISGSPVFAQCAQPRSQKGVHPVCKQVISF